MSDAPFPHGPLAVLDADGSAYGVEGIVLDCPATSRSRRSGRCTSPASVPRACIATASTPTR
ncbi:hypothetical protein [Streptomyces massasporeus]|uniref:hypothetical protein n=1 Tax=Streptomyces massasporeus TaxID=67324 RepID=UPI003F4CEAFE